MHSGSDTFVEDSEQPYVHSINFCNKNIPRKIPYSRVSWRRQWGDWTSVRNGKHLSKVSWRLCHVVIVLSTSLSSQRIMFCLFCEIWSSLPWSWEWDYALLGRRWLIGREAIDLLVKTCLTTLKTLSNLSKYFDTVKKDYRKKQELLTELTGNCRYFQIL